MFFSPIKGAVEKAAIQNAAAFAQAIDRIRRKIAHAEKLTEAGERYLAFLEIEKKIRNYMKRANQKVNKQTKDLLVDPMMKNSAAGALGVWGAASALVLVGSTLLTGGAGLVVVGAGIALLPGSLAFIPVAESRKSRRSEKNVFLEERNNFMPVMQDLLESAVSQKEAVFQNDLPALLASPYIEALCDKAPPVQAAFAKAAIKDGVFSPPVKLDKSSSPHPKP